MEVDIKGTLRRLKLDGGTRGGQASWIGPTKAHGRGGRRQLVLAVRGLQKPRRQTRRLQLSSAGWNFCSWRLARWWVLFWGLQFASDPPGRYTLLHRIRLFAIFAAKPSRLLARQRWDELKPLAALGTSAILDLLLLHAGILADRREVSILNLVVGW